MTIGNWTPISKAAVIWLPQDRPYSKVEALFSIQVKINNDEPVTENGLATLWQWNRESVRTFLRKLDVYIEYQEGSRNNPYRRGQTRQVTRQLPDNYPTTTRQVKAIFGAGLPLIPDNYPTTTRQLPDKYSDTSIKTLKTKDLKEEPKDLKKKIETYLPEDFGISAGVKAWAEKEGYGNLDRHLAYFRDAALAKGYKYIDWDAAFRNAIKSNWAKIESGVKGGQVGGRQEQPRKISKMEQAINNLEALRNGEMVVKRDNHGVEENYITVSAGYSTE